MSKNVLDLHSLVPREATFVLSDKPGQTFTLCRWTLRVRAWAFDTYGAERLKQIFEELQILPISELAYFMLKDKTAFPNLGAFQDCFATTQDQIELTKALLASVGIGEPEIEKISEATAKKTKKEKPGPNPQSPKNP